MKTTKIITAAVCSALFCSTQLFGQGITTLICQNNETNQVQITSSQTAKIRTFWDYFLGGTGPGTATKVSIQNGTKTVIVPASQLFAGSTPHPSEFMIAGPATISLVTHSDGASAILTLDIEPGPYPPGKTATVGSNSGNVQVTMEMSTDLVNWTPAVNAQVYTNSPDARFFRIKLVTNASP